ncbi:MAG: hypothetical protein EOO00_07140 [Chitinophagaceae bacterium]|nr:MAG: hypothetical protein EOO00_07140 [Chitinophagaceae bacterium]
MKHLLNMSLTRFKRLFFLLPVLAVLASCQKTVSHDIGGPEHNLTISFRAQVDTMPLEFGTTYHNFFDEPYTVSAFKFYVHGIHFINTETEAVFEVAKDRYDLIDFADSASASIKIGVLPGKYNRIAFTIGVDSARNVSGAQTGALDPTKGMFWTWNTGYIMAKLEGNSPVAATPNNAFEYHIGGFRTGENVVEKITLLFPYTTLVDLQPNKTSDLYITTNLSAWFHNPHDIRISENPVSMTPGPLAVQIAENYRKMFSVAEILNEP